MITIISATNRPDSNTRKVAEIYQRILAQKGLQSKLFSLEDLPADTLSACMYEDLKCSPDFAELHKTMLEPTTKFIFVIPEYNGSIPGVLKLMIDASDIRKCYYFKKACLVGVSSGRAGNLRGLDHLTNILNHVKAEVLPNKLPLSRIAEEIDKKGRFANEATGHAVSKQLDDFIKF